MSKEFWIDTGKRMAWTFAEALLGCITIGQTVTEIAWKHAFSIALVATLVCFLKQIKAYTEEDRTAQILAKEMKTLGAYAQEYVEEPEDACVPFDEEEAYE